MKTTFDDAICPTPSGAGGNHQGLSGGYPIVEGHGEKGLMNSPYDEPCCPTPGGKETSSSELGTTPTLTDVKDAPAGQPTGVSSPSIIDDHQSNQTFGAGGSGFKS